jgi:hypothetical protein
LVRSCGVSCPFTSRTRMAPFARRTRKSGRKLPDAALEDVVQLEAEVVVLDPRMRARVAVECEGFTRLPCAVVDAEVDVGAARLAARARRPPRQHVARGADRTLAVEHEPAGDGTLGTNVPEQVLHDAAPC